MPETKLDHARLIGLMDSPFWLGKGCKQTPAPVIRSVLRGEHTTPWHLFLQLVIDLDVDDPALVAAWKRALDAVLGLQSDYAWGSKQKRAKLAALAADPVMLSAIQGTVAHAEDPRLELLAVLVIDASKESLDALVGHFERAVESADRRLDRLARLRKHARSTPALDAMFAEVESTLDGRNAASGALALGPLLGVGAVDELWFQVTIGSRRQTASNVPLMQGHVRIDSRQPEWMSVSLSRLNPGSTFTSTFFTESVVHGDHLRLGRCTAAELPDWLARAATKLKVEWEVSYVRSSLRGKNRERVATWLFGAAPAPKRRRRK